MIAAPAPTTPPTPLTTRQHKILDAIRDSRARRGCPATVAELAAVTSVPAGIVRGELAALMHAGWLRPTSPQPAPQAPSDPVEPPTEPTRPLLTPKQREALQLAAEGLGDIDIGKWTCTSVNTVKTHLSRAYAALGATGRCHAIAIAIRAGIIR